MQRTHYFIFDLDGTLYRYDKGHGTYFRKSSFHAAVKSRILQLISERSPINPFHEYERIKREYSGDFAEAMLRLYNVHKKHYYEYVWSIDPRKYVRRNKFLRSQLLQVSKRFIILTGSPKIWALSVLDHLGIRDIVGNSIITYESGYRKPSQEAFLHALNKLKSIPERTFVIGDDEQIDIFPAKSIGIKTLLIGKSSKSSADFKSKSFGEAIARLKRNGYI
jgi:HAD superfamily hydrolase (TIGR01509 family)